jgi:hypothetical protein
MITLEQLKAIVPDNVSVETVTGGFRFTYVQKPADYDGMSIVKQIDVNGEIFLQAALHETEIVGKVVDILRWGE